MSEDQIAKEGAGQISGAPPSRTGGPSRKKRAQNSSELFSGALDLDLFGYPMQRQRDPRGKPSYHVTQESRRQIGELAARGLTPAKISAATGIAQSTLYLHHREEARVRTGQRGRRQHDPSAASRSLVRAMADQGSTRIAIAAALGISTITLAKHYRPQLNVTKRSNREEAL